MTTKKEVSLAERLRKISKDAVAKEVERTLALYPTICENLEKFAKRGSFECPVAAILPASAFQTIRLITLYEQLIYDGCSILFLEDHHRLIPSLEHLHYHLSKNLDLEQNLNSTHIVWRE